MARAEVEWPQGIDQGPVADRLASQDVPCLNEVAAGRDANGRGAGSAQGIILEPAIPGTEHGEALVVIGHVELPECAVSSLHHTVS